MKKLLLPIIFVLCIAAIASMACGDSDDEEAKATPAPTTPSVQQITVRGIEQGEQYLFDPKDVRVQPGTIRVNFVNAGVERPHSLVVKNKAGDGDLVNSDRVELGQSKTLEFTVTEEGNYKLVCLIRGHEDRGMVGTFVVSRSTGQSQPGPSQPAGSVAGTGTSGSSYDSY